MASFVISQSGNKREKKKKTNKINKISHPKTKDKWQATRPRVESKTHRWSNSFGTNFNKHLTTIFWYTILMMPINQRCTVHMDSRTIKRFGDNFFVKWEKVKCLWVMTNADGIYRNLNRFGCQMRAHTIFGKQWLTNMLTYVECRNRDAYFWKSNREWCVLLGLFFTLHFSLF